MTEQRISSEKRKTEPLKPKGKEQEEQRSTDIEVGGSGLASLQQQVGNRAVQRLIAQCSDERAFELDDDTAERIMRERSGGQSLEIDVQERMGTAIGHDFGDVRVHTSPASDELNRQLGAKAFTTGRDIFFREGAYKPHSSAGQELIAHELTHVAQQSSGAVGSGGGRMTVNAPGDAFEQEADAVAKSVTAPEASAQIQRQAEAEEEVQMQEMPEEEEELQMQAEEEEEEGVMP
jgi:hypothetical protein